jgi:RNA polymerase sigma-70 factor (ECF subfamily)
VTDDELIERARLGDSTALSDLLRRHHPRLHAVCLRILGRRADADDAAQNALISIARGLPSFDGRSAFSTWAHRIATNAALDELRRRRRRPQPRLDVTDSRGHTGDHDDRAEIALQAYENRQLVEEALAGLPDDFRVAVVLRDVADLDYESIASILDVPIGTVRSRIARGRALLAAAVGNSVTGSRRQSLSDGDAS